MTNRLCPSLSADSEQTNKTDLSHVQLYNSGFGTVRCSCGLWACFGTIPGKCTKEFQEHIEKETLNPTEAGTRLRANVKPLHVLHRTKPNLDRQERRDQEGGALQQ